VKRRFSVLRIVETGGSGRGETVPLKQEILMAILYVFREKAKE
jgi:hypothetical protein